MNEMEEAIVHGLRAHPKRLPPALLYDDLGSMLFEAITLLPEYEVTRAGARLLQTHKAAITSGGPWHVVELGPGAGKNAAVIMQAHVGRTRFIGIDVSAQALRECRSTLESLAEVQTFQATYFEGLTQAASERADAHWLVAFLGSNLSNFDRADAEAFFTKLRAVLRKGDRFLLATDLDKDPDRLIPAYCDALGVTAAFNKNLLVRLNREWAADFVLSDFTHVAVWNADARRVEMHLQAGRAADVHVRALSLKVHLTAGERIFTEGSHRFSTDELRRWGVGFTVKEQWIDAAWPFAMTLYEAI